MQKNKYGELIVDFKATISSLYPSLQFKGYSPGKFGGYPSIYLKGNTLNIPSGIYESSNYYHKYDHAIMAIESEKDCELNLKGKPLLLLKSIWFSGTYRSLTQNFYLFGQNENESFFCHQVRPCIGKTGDLNLCRKWIWNLKEGELLVDRQGDLAFIILNFIPRNKGKENAILSMGNHHIYAKKIVQLKTKTYVYKPDVKHPEHYPVSLPSWYEARLAKVWYGSSD